ncbi:MAG: transposase, partial [Gemmataceae bacterium]
GVQRPETRRTLLARWEEGYAEPWLVLTDLPPESASAAWYGLRTWIEQGFKVIKGGGWDREKTRMEDPERVERSWLVLAVATLWVVALGVADEVLREHEERIRRAGRLLRESQQQAQQREQAERERRQRQAQEARRRREDERRAAKAARPTKAKAVRHPETGATALSRAHRVSVGGLAILAAAWARGESPLPAHLHPEPWPLADQPLTPWNEQDFLAPPNVPL